MRRFRGVRGLQARVGSELADFRTIHSASVGACKLCVFSPPLLVFRLRPFHTPQAAHVLARSRRPVCSKVLINFLILSASGNSGHGGLITWPHVARSFPEARFWGEGSVAERVRGWRVNMGPGVLEDVLEHGV